MTTKRRLGRGLEALFGRSFHTENEPVVMAMVDSPGVGTAAAATASADLTHVAISDIDPNPYQPRKSFEPAELHALAESIRQHGVIQPIVVRRVGQRYQLIAGERRWHAAQEAGLNEVPARIIEADEQQVFELAIVENLQRSDLNAIEKAKAFRDYLDRFECTHEDLAARLSVDRSTVTNFVRLLELPEEVQQAVVMGKLTQGHARALLSLGDSDRQVELCREIISQGLSVRQVESRVSAASNPSPRVRSKCNPHRTTYVGELESAMRQRLAAKVEIKLRGKEQGQIVISFSSNDEFDRIVQAICGEPTRALVA